MTYYLVKKEEGQRARKVRFPGSLESLARDMQGMFQSLLGEREVLQTEDQTQESSSIQQNQSQDQQNQVPGQQEEQQQPLAQNGNGQQAGQQNGNGSRIERGIERVSNWSESHRKLLGGIIATGAIALTSLLAVNYLGSSRGNTVFDGSIEGYRISYREGGRNVLTVKDKDARFTYTFIDSKDATDLNWHLGENDYVHDDLEKVVIEGRTRNVISRDSEPRTITRGEADELLSKADRAYGVIRTAIKDRKTAERDDYVGNVKSSLDQIFSDLSSEDESE